MRIGLVGDPGAGKTTLFSALTGLEAKPGGRGGIRTHLGVIKVPDERIDKLAKIFQRKRAVYAEITLVDFSFLHIGTEEGSFPPVLLNHLKEMECLALILPNFDLAGGSPLRSLTAFESEIKLVDLQTIENRLSRLKKEKGHETEKPLLEELKNFVESDRSLRDRQWADDELARISGFGFLSLKPLLLVVNTDESKLGSPIEPDLSRYLEDRGLVGIQISAKLEMEISQLQENERKEFLEALGIAIPGRIRFIETAYSNLDLVSFLTIGSDEVRAWSIRRGTTALKAAGKVHSDIEKGFIRAEVVSYADFMRHGSEAKCREAGKHRLEGRDYIVRDGDIVHFRFHA
jgi:GTP-binding protein YchF